MKCKDLELKVHKEEELRLEPEAQERKERIDAQELKKSTRSEIRNASRS